jgi:hypothetical protein
VLAINSIDDEVNPPETGLMTRAMKRLKNGRLFLILTSDETSGHLTTGQAKFYSRSCRDCWTPCREGQKPRKQVDVAARFLRKLGPV